MYWLLASGSTAPVPSAATEAWVAAPAALAEPAKPPPLPLQEQGAGRPPDRDPQLPMLAPTRGGAPERRRFDVRGFLAGFALSWAFGVVLYLFMTAG